MKILLPVSSTINLFTFLDFDIYNIHVKTSDKLYSGTDNDIYITLSGEKDGRQKNTGEFLLDKSGRNDFERNQIDDFRIPATALGWWLHQTR